MPEINQEVTTQTNEVVENQQVTPEVKETAPVDDKKDYSTLQERIEKLEKNYFKSQGIEGEELETAIKTYKETLNKDKIKLEEDNKTKDLRIKELEEMLNTTNNTLKKMNDEKVINSLYSELKVLDSSKEDLLTLTKITDEDYVDGNLDSEKVKAKMEEVLKRNPSFVKQERPTKAGFYNEKQEETSKPARNVPKKAWNKFN